MSKIEMVYEGNLRIRSKLNQAEIVTDGPKVIGGEGEYYSPTDLLALALGSCVITLVQVRARNLKLNLGEITGSVEKEMAKDGPRRIGKVKVVIDIPFSPTPEQEKELNEAALTCPVHHSLHPDLIQEIELKFQ